MAVSTVWISYDLSVRGDYEGLYAWLDAHDAKECGNSIAVLTYRHSGSLPDKLKADLKKNVAIDKHARVYIIYRDETTQKNKGTFIFSGRRAAPWTGFAAQDTETVDNEV